MARSQSAAIQTLEVMMIKLFTRSFRLLSLGGAKASTNGADDLKFSEGDDRTYQ